MKLVCEWLFRYRVFGGEKLNHPGPVLLIPNHVSWLDWLFLGVVLEEDWKFVVSGNVAEMSWIHRKIMMGSRSFPVEMGSPYGLKEIAQYLHKGGRLVLFAEGRLTRTGSLMKLYDGIGFLVQKSEAKILLGYFRGVKRLKWVQHLCRTEWFPDISLHIREADAVPAFGRLKPADQRKRLTTWLTRQMMNHQFECELAHSAPSVPEEILLTARKNASAIIFQDVSMKKLSMKQFVIGADLIAREIEDKLGPEEKRLGILLPNVNANPVSLMASWLMGRIPTTFNYTSGTATMLQCAQLADVRHVITSRTFLEKARIDIRIMEEDGIQFIFLEDVRPRITSSKKLAALLRFHFEPEQILRKKWTRDDTAVILFTSGSEGVPKGVQLTHQNFFANVEQVLAVTDINDTDRIFNPLPLFHSFGLTIGTMLPMLKGIYSFLFPNPLSYKIIPSTVYDLNCTVTMGTNTFLNQYAQQAHPMDFRNIRYLVAGAEKLQDSTFDLWNEKFGVRILQGYGATETAPVVSVNTHMFHKKGTTGLPLPGVQVRIEKVDGIETGGRVFIKGPNVMKGYLNTEPNQQFQALNGWYDTGDIGVIDEDGFLILLGRLKRFAKISGEMVSLTAVEQALNSHFTKLYGDESQVVVVSCPDESKGEKLVLFSNKQNLDSQAVRDAIQLAGLSTLCIPKDLRYLEEIPTLGTGKTDYLTLSRMANQP
ncbi:MAG: AMP-binding protein [Verrucomicrobia bacterium]|nr:AMP-binding protein [Verrucomicrobiota bacterium]